MFDPEDEDATALLNAGNYLPAGSRTIAEDTNLHSVTYNGFPIFTTCCLALVHTPAYLKELKCFWFLFGDSNDRQNLFARKSEDQGA